MGLQGSRDQQEPFIAGLALNPITQQDHGPSLSEITSRLELELEKKSSFFWY